jgi:hypothetical protein
MSTTTILLATTLYLLVPIGGPSSSQVASHQVELSSDVRRSRVHLSTGIVLEVAEKGSARLTDPASVNHPERIKVTTLIAWGEKDGIFSKDQQDALVHATPDARLIAYAGVGHAQHWEQPDRFVADLLAFLKEPGRMAASTTPSPQASACSSANALTPAEQSAGWVLLFDGKSTASWHGYNGQSTASWAIEDCSLKTSGTATNYGSDRRADLVTDREFTNFELTLDWKATRGGNSGVVYGIVEDKKYEAPWMTGPEYQLLDDVGFPQKVAPSQKAGSNYGMQPPDESQKTLKPVGEWNTTRIVVNGPHVEHWLNGRKILEFERWTPEWKALVAAGKWKEYPEYGLAKSGRIALQDHGSVFWFRNIKIREIGRE